MAPRDNNNSGNGFNDTFIPWVAGEPLPPRDSGGKAPRGKSRGRHPHNQLTALTMRQLGPGRHADGEGLYLFVRESGARQWMQRIVIQGRRRDLGLGPFPRVTLAAARRVAVDNRRVARAGGDPTLEAARKNGPTFRRIYEIVTEIRRKNWTKTTEASWCRGFDKYVLPVIGDKPVAAVTLEDVRGIVVPLFNGRNSTGYILRQNIEYVLRYAVVEKHRSDNPAADLKWLLPTVRKAANHRPSLPYRQAPEAMVEWQALSINPAVRLAVLFIVLTAARLSEATEATWSEIDLSERIWTVPARRMKARRGHEVPLSWQALEVLAQARKLQRSDSLIFAMDSNRAARPPSQRTVSDALRRLGRVDEDGRPITAHGFRSTFRVWAMECVPGSSETAEVALAHEESDRTKKAYARSTLDGPRAKLMQEWADYVLSPSDGSGDG